MNPQDPIAEAVVRSGPREVSANPAGAGAVREAVVAAASRSAFRRFAFLAVLVTGAFALRLVEWVRFSLKTSLFSHLLLIPVVSAWWIWRWAGGEQVPEARPSRGWAALAVAVAGLLVGAYWLAGRGSATFPTTEYLCLMTAAYLMALLAAALLTLGAGVVRAFRFPVLFLAFMVPWPQAMVDGVETALQLASAEAAHLLLLLSGLPLLRDGLVFKLPGITFEVAQECSGIRSSLVLLITSVLAAHLLLRTRWRRWALVLAVLPLGVLRNGFRILTIALLCVHVDPGMIDSPIHHQGGPIFFVLSLIPFLWFLWWLRRGERAPAPKAAGN
jgi:exosortase C (VPDSG-CTERM-specific)